MKMSFDAKDPKAGMSLAEIKSYVDRAVGLAETNGNPTEDMTVQVMITFRGHVKQLNVEV